MSLIHRKVVIEHVGMSKYEPHRNENYEIRFICTSFFLCNTGVILELGHGVHLCSKMLMFEQLLVGMVW
jgi:hypothetical protein